MTSLRSIRRIAMLATALVLGIMGIEAFATPAHAAVSVDSLSLVVSNSERTLVQVGDSVQARLNRITPMDTNVSWEWFCGSTSLGEGIVGTNNYTTSVSPYSTYSVYPKDAGCESIHAVATTTDAVFSFDELSLTPISVSGGSNYPSLQSPGWSLLQGYDASMLDPGSVVVTNWGTTPVTNLACSIADSHGNTHFEIFDEPADTLQPQSATVVQIKPVSGLTGDSSESYNYGYLTNYNDTLMCSASNGKLSTFNIPATVYLEPHVEIVGFRPQVGDTLDANQLASPFPMDSSLRYEWFYQEGDETTTAISNAETYTVTPADIGKTLGLTATVSVPGHGDVSGSDTWTIRPVSVTGAESWSVVEGYTTVDPTSATVTFTNFGESPLSGVLTCGSTEEMLAALSILSCGDSPVATDLAPDGQVTVTVTPKVGLKIGTYDVSPNLTYKDGDIPIYLSVHLSFSVSQEGFQWILPTDETYTQGGDSNANQGGEDNSNQGGSETNQGGNGENPGGDNSSPGEDSNLDKSGDSSKTDEVNNNGGIGTTAKVETGGAVSNHGSRVVLTGLTLIIMGAVLLKRTAG